MKFAVTISFNPFLKAPFGKAYKLYSKDEQKMFLIEALAYPFKDLPDPILETYCESHKDGRQHLHATIDVTYEQLEAFKNHICNNYMMKNDRKDWILNVQEWYQGCWEKYIRKDWFYNLPILKDDFIESLDL